MEKERNPQTRPSTAFRKNPRSRLAPPWLRRLYKIGHLLPRFIAWLTDLPHFSLFFLILGAAAMIFLRVYSDTDPLSGLAVALIGGPLFSLAFCLILPLLIPLAAFLFLMIRRVCRSLARLGGWVLPDPKPWNYRRLSRLHPWGEMARRKGDGKENREDWPVRALMGKVAEMWEGE